MARSEKVSAKMTSKARKSRKADLNLGALVFLLVATAMILWLAAR